ncbi:hypothetical protein C8Q74DRAFT_1190233 [Fomes fomentarius]|nr:hypothetical protein C8Q74DRAFT_1190233 [Fomes fomentarius]
MTNLILARPSPGPPQSKPELVPTFDTTPQAHMTPRIALPLPFSAPCLANANRVDFSLRGCRGVSLSEWARLAEKRKTHLALDDAHASLEDVFESEEQGRLLFQSHWPGYDVRTCFLDMPQHVAAGEGPLTRVSLLDMVCQALVDWVVNISNCRHIECREPKWAIGLKQITFRHIYVTGVVEVKGYVNKWVPVLEIDPLAFQAQCQL